jgi:hypothetical protein
MGARGWDPGDENEDRGSTRMGDHNNDVEGDRLTMGDEGVNEKKAQETSLTSLGPPVSFFFPFSHFIFILLTIF